ncbi:hypothetical protein KR067_004582 [Drosophila pandora]|nr:hypothetical protein KR067_004582 [Drosophila pandora]
MGCRFNPFYVGPEPPSCTTDANSKCDCPPCSPDTGYQEPRPVYDDCVKDVSKKETKEKQCNPPCKDCPKAEKSSKKGPPEEKDKKPK